MSASRSSCFQQPGADLVERGGGDVEVGEPDRGRQLRERVDEVVVEPPVARLAAVDALLEREHAALEVEDRGVALHARGAVVVLLREARRPEVGRLDDVVVDRDDPGDLEVLRSAHGRHRTTNRRHLTARQMGPPGYAPDPCPGVTRSASTTLPRRRRSGPRCVRSSTRTPRPSTPTRRLSATTTTGTPAHMKRSREWQRVLHDNGWAGITWPKEFGGRGATAMQQTIFNEEQARYDVSAGALSIGIGMVGADAHGARHRRAEAPPRRDAARRRDLVPALQRAGRGLRPRVARDARRARRRRVRRQRPEGLEHVRAVRRLGHPPRPDRSRRAEAPWHHLLPRRHAHARASTCARCARSAASRTSTRCSSTTCASRRRTCSARSTRAGAWRTRRSATSGR